MFNPDMLPDTVSEQSLIKKRRCCNKELVKSPKNENKGKTESEPEVFLTLDPCYSQNIFTLWPKKVIVKSDC